MVIEMDDSFDRSTCTVAFAAVVAAALTRLEESCDTETAPRLVFAGSRIEVLVAYASGG